MSELTRTHHQHLSPSTLHLLDHLLRGLDILALRMSSLHLGLQDVPHICRTSVNGATSAIRRLVFFQISGEDRNEKYLSCVSAKPTEMGITRYLVEIVALQGIIQERLYYIALNVFCLAFRVPTLSKAGLRAGNLSLANMIPLFAGAHLSFLADAFTVRRG